MDTHKIVNCDLDLTLHREFCIITFETCNSFISKYSIYRMTFYGWTQAIIFVHELLNDNNLYTFNDHPGSNQKPNFSNILIHTYAHNKIKL